ncbi:MAG: MarR family transcriptional regulator [Deltaproteobacteria bacterium]|nr:MAG: MarR family transcriptional regulator [Deltaproteobacteria bacterium]
MNNNTNKTNDVLLDYQTKRLQDLIEEIIQCCKKQTSDLSKKFNIPEAELDCLLLFGDERYLTAKSIAQKLDVVRSRVTKITTGLIRKGLVESIEDPKDARVKLIGLTQKGQKKSKEVSAIITDLHRKLLLELDPKQRKMVLSYLEALRLGMEVVKK